MSLTAENNPTILFKIRSSLACVPCRSRHVKCDSEKPNCIRCVADGKNCHYIRSRRGLQHQPSPRNFSTSEPPPRHASNSNLVHVENSGVDRPVAMDATLEMSHPQTMRAFPAQILGSSGRSELTSPNSAQNSVSPYLDLYYTFFHPAHPYILPRRRFDVYLRTQGSIVGDLLVVLEFIASSYTSEGQSAELKRRAVNTMSRDDLPLTGFTVQALLLLAISVHCCNSFELGRSFLDKASSIALDIGMQLKCFAATHSNGDVVLEESWRRTWWGLYVVDGIFQAIRRSLSFALWHIQAEVDLPCEESEFESERIPEPRSIYEYSERDFAEDEISYSSFAYLIDIVRIMGSVMAIAGDGGDFSDSRVDATDAAMVNWELHLPDCKKDVLTVKEETDELLFYAHIIFNVTKVFLHRQRSRLIHSPVENLAKCAPPPPPSDIPISQRRSYWLSTKKTMGGAERALNLFTTPTDLVKHSPLMVCAVALSILAELSACSYVLHGKEYEAARTRIRLGIGTLKKYGKIWPVGGQTLSEIKAIARAVFAMDRARTNPVEASVVENPASNAAPSINTQSYFDEFGVLEYFDLPEISGQF